MKKAKSALRIFYLVHSTHMYIHTCTCTCRVIIEKGLFVSVLYVQYTCTVDVEKTFTPL